jgi:hypothetical protein
MLRRASGKRGDRERSASWEVAVARMAQAGVVPITWVAVLGELLRDWRDPIGQDLGPIMREHLPFYGNLYGSLMAAKGHKAA